MRDGNQHGFVLSNGLYTTIDVPGSVLTGIFSINAQGEIVGSYDDAGGVSHGFVGTPATERCPHLAAERRPLEDWGCPHFCDKPKQDPQLDQNDL